MKGTVMKNRPSQGFPVRLLSGLPLALLLCLLVDGVLTVTGHVLPLWVFPAGLAALLVLLALPKGLRAKTRLALFAGLAALCLLAAAVLFLWWYRYSQSAPYRPVDDGKAALYGGKRVMFFVPHQDDDLNLMGGMIEEYVRYGSEIYPVFFTTGDSDDPLSEGLRSREALEVLGDLGVPEEQVIFLGYACGWEESDLYDAPMDMPMLATNGHAATYGLPEHPAFREGHPYTHRGAAEDIAALIGELRPEIIFCNDYDYHINHATLSMFFEEAMGQVLRELPDYHPTVFKGVSYSLAFFGVDDFYSPNILATANGVPVPYLYERPDYRWDARVRFPVSAASLSRSVESSGLFRSLRQYRSQTAWINAMGIINGDKVFWHRPTDSLCYGAEITVSSGDASVLNNFKLLDSRDLADFGRMPYDDTWVTEAGDTERSARVSFPEAVTLSAVRLYDDPDIADNVKNAEIVFDDGTRLETGALDEQGAPNDFRFAAKRVTGFTVRILDSEGEGAGITEIEAYAELPSTGQKFVKLQNENGDFVYDYRIRPGGQEDFSLYTAGMPSLTAEDYTVSCEGAGCRAEIVGQRVRVSCPRGKECTVTVQSRDGSAADTAFFSNRAPIADFPQRMEDFVWHAYPLLQQTAAYRGLRFVYHLFAEENIVI